jgi:crotonobetainyl-CoA:carnitine CoA-transferase CaiB-like acyl-CoA transferase
MDAVPAVGAHTAQILAELGHTDAEVADLRAAHVI